MNSFTSAQTLTALPRAVDDLYPRIFDAILDQRIHVTSRFTEDSLAQMFGARRSDIREVLTRLSLQQIILLRPNHRPCVARLDPEQTRQALHARRLTEITLVRLACQQPRTQDLNALRALINSERECAARGASIRLSGAFHLQLANMAGNAPLAHFLDSLVALTSVAMAWSEQDFCARDEHEAIVDAVERRDAAMAEKLMGRHLDHLERLLSSHSAASRHRVAG